MYTELGHINVKGVRYDLYRHQDGRLMYKWRFEFLDASTLPPKVQKAALKQGHPVFCQKTADDHQKEKDRIEIDIGKTKKGLVLKEDELPAPSRYAQA